MIVLYVLTFLGIALFEIPSLIQKKYWWELGVFMFFYSFAFLIGLLQILQINIPNPIEGITTLVTKIIDLVPI